MEYAVIAGWIAFVGLLFLADARVESDNELINKSYGIGYILVIMLFVIPLIVILFCSVWN